MQEADVWITMRDGVRLAADIYRPRVSDGEQVPTVLVRTTYDKTNPTPDVDAARLATCGYAVVVQDVRGRHKSDGVFYHGVNEVRDGNDTLNWIATQNWSNGRIGMTGISYLAAVQTAAACAGNEHLRSLLHIFAPADYYRFGHRHGGLAALYMLPIMFMFASSGKEAQSDATIAAACDKAFADSEAWLQRLPLKPGSNPLSQAPQIEKWLLDIMNNADYGDFWRSVELWQPLEHLSSHADIPCLFVGGWYDMYREEQFYEALSKRNKACTQLLMGPWTHLNFHAPDTPLGGDVDFGEEARFGQEELFALQLEWFDSTLKEKRDKVEGAPVRIFVMGGGAGEKTETGKLMHGGRWREEKDWPPPEHEQTPYYLHSGGSLSRDEPPDASPTRYLADPRQPVPTVGGVHYFLLPNWQLAVPYGPQDQREWLPGKQHSRDLPLTSRHDLLAFATPPLERDTEVTGKPMLILWVSSSAPDTDFIVRLIDVYPTSRDYPDGYAMNLSEGVIRMRYRETSEHAVPMSAGEIYPVEIELYPTSNLFVRGHRIRVDIASSSFPAYDLNPQTGGPLLDAAEQPTPAVNLVYHDPEHPSRMILPLIADSRR